jgi:hypothetical protein
MQNKAKRPTVELLPPRPQIKRKRWQTTVDPKKLAKVSVVEPVSSDESIERLLIFDSKLLDEETSRALVKIVPQLLMMRKTWKAYFSQHGCISCKRKKVGYASGGLCSVCYGRLGHRIRACFRNIGKDRDIEGEFVSIIARYDAAQALLNG